MILAEIFQRVEVLELFRETSIFISNNCNSCSSENLSNKDTELIGCSRVTDKQEAAVTLVTEGGAAHVQLNLKDVEQREIGEPVKQKNIHVSPNMTCYWCGSSDLWQGDDRMICRRCHPPAPGAEKVTFSGKTRGY